ncbi:MAG: phenylalanine--tRNA ligase subunit beta [Puniceicoccales bacterium]|jgi:phenylalanyl-tRNA synthetase beta chain|nr:phenylalanine--tRNA ligase subunit beta [Puniceicoccales bacterium]
MKVRLNWLRHYVNVDVGVGELADIFTSLGFEVEGVERIGLQRQDTLLVGEIKEIRQHPNADKLSVCQVCVGDGDVRQIVCGAKNFKLFDHVPVALPGTVLPGGEKINSSTLRGVQSDGMMCSGRELGMGDDHSGLMILDATTSAGTNLHDALEIASDVVFDLAVTPNRGDCLSYIGMARELACKLGKQLKLPPFQIFDISQPDKCMGSIVVESDKCSCYHAFGLKGVKVGPSPAWLANDLKASGIKSINSVVDICNWVMLETGNPMHAFDLRKIRDLELNIRYARDGESIVGLDGKKHDLNRSVTVIADSGQPLVIAGIIGSIDAEIDNATTDILVESACFDSAAIMQSSRALGISTDSSNRFARSVDACTCEYAGNRAVGMILDICGGEYVHRDVAKGHTHIPAKLSVPREFIARKLGFGIDREYTLRILSALGFGVELDGDAFAITVPSHRHDVTIAEDIAEECLRMCGTDKIPNGAVRLESVHRDDAEPFVFCKGTRRLLADCNFFECYNYSLTDSAQMDALCGKGNCIKLSNPLLSDQNSYRPSLIPGLLSTLRFNIQNGNFDGRFFEVGKVAARVDGEFSEYLAVALVALEKSLDRTVTGACGVNFNYLKKICLDILANILDLKQIDLQIISNSQIWQPGYAAEYCQLPHSGVDVKCGLINRKTLKSFFDLKHNVWGAEIMIADFVLGEKSARHTYEPFSQFPRVSKDISVIVPEEEFAGNVQRALEECIQKSLTPGINLEYIKLFDIYSGESVAAGKKAFGFEISFRSNGRTLTDGEVQHLLDASRCELEKIYEIRGI